MELFRTVCRQTAGGGVGRKGELITKARTFLMRRITLVAVLTLCCVAATRIAQAYPVQYAASLADMAQQADLICKAVVVAIEPVKDDWFEPVQGYQAYLGDLAEIIRTKRQPQQWWGGAIPWGVSWNILFKYAEGRPAAAWNEGQFNSVLDALEYPASGDPKGPTYYSSSEPRDLYALYLQYGLAARAKKFRAECKKALPYDMDYYFDMVDKSPATYKRQ